jgi:hypothetical protein
MRHDDKIGFLFDQGSEPLPHHGAAVDEEEFDLAPGLGPDRGSALDIARRTDRNVRPGALGTARHRHQWWSAKPSMSNDCVM